MPKYNIRVLQIETTNICNSNCVFCIHSSLKKFGTMKDSLFTKILLDAKKIPSIEVIVPMMLGEPFCDKKIISRLKLINKILPERTIHLFTNGSLLTKKIIRELSTIKYLMMHFSLNGNKQTRKKLMGLDDYDHVVKMIDLYKKTGKPFEVLLVDHPSISNENISIPRDWNFNLIIYRNWTGDKFKGKPRTHCIRAIGHMTIMYDGRVNLCCMEYGKVIFGDLNKQSILEVWNSPHRQMYCKAHAEGKFLKGVCSNCT